MIRFICIRGIKVYKANGSEEIGGNQLHLISVVVPIYNSELYLTQCIQSILAQTYPNFDVILVDDGSTDLSGKLCDNFAKKDYRLRVIHTNNQGALLARMTGVRHARGEYICFIDSDDWIEENYLETLLTPFIKHDIDICVTPYKIENTHNHFKINFLSTDNIVLDSQQALYRMYEGVYYDWAFHGKLYKKSLFDMPIQWCTTISYGEDTEANWILFQRANNVFLSSKYLYNYRNRPDSMMHQKFTLGKLVYLDRLLIILKQIKAENTLLHRVFVSLLSFYGIIYLLMMLQENPILYKDQIAYYQKELLRYNAFIPHKIFSDGAYKTHNQRSISVAQMTPSEFKTDCANRKQELLERVRPLFMESQNIYIFGAGVIAGEVAQILEANNLPYIGFVVSKKKVNCFRKHKVISLDEALTNHNKNITLILAMNEKNVLDVLNSGLKNQQINIINAGKYSLRY